MKAKHSVSVGHCSKVSLLSLLAIWTHISYAAPNGNISPHSKDFQSSTGRSSSTFDASTVSTDTPSFASGISNSDYKLLHPATQTYVRRIARDVIMNTKPGMTDISRLFPSNLDYKFQKWIELLNSKPKTSDWDEYECRYDDEECVEEDDQPAIDLLNGKKPRYMDESIGLERQGTVTVWPGEDPIVLQRHHMNKKSRYYSTPVGLIPKMFLSRVQVDPRRSNLLYSRSSFTL